MQRRNELWIIVVDVTAIDVVTDVVAIDVVDLIMDLTMDLILCFGCLYYFSSKLE